MDTHDGGTRRERAVEAFAGWLASFAGQAVSEEALLANRLMGRNGSYGSAGGIAGFRRALE